ncbi:MAG: hypothetical protein JEZ08_16505 [Clostridiales bacterium]|nr:hypothetical protein [Clostridiales bacterium]
MKNTKRILILVLLFSFLFSISAFAMVEDETAEPSFFEEVLIGAAKFIPNLVADMIRGLGVDTNNVYLPGSPFLFSFSPDNVFGAFTAKAYPIFKTIAIIMVSPTIGLVAFSILTSKSGQSRLEAFNKIKVLLLAVVAMWFLPDVIAQIFAIRNELAIGMSNFFGGGEGISFLDEMATLAYAGDLFDAFIYLASTLFTLWLMFNYIGLSFGFAIVFLYTPIALILTPARFGKQVFGELMKDFVGFTLTPLFDITLLGVVATTREIMPNFSLTGNASALLPNLISVALIMMVIPVRSGLKQKLGFGSALGDSLGTGLAMGAMAMVMRGGKRGKSSTGGGSQVDRNEKTADQTQEEADYYDQLPSQEGMSSASVDNTGSSDSIDYHDALDDIDFAETPRGQFVKDNIDKSYFNESDIGGLSNKERASVLNAKANEQRHKDEVNKHKQRFKTGAKIAGSVYGGALGASAGMFGGSRGMLMGGYAGAKAGSFVADKTSNGTSDLFGNTATGAVNQSRKVLAGMAWNRQNGNVSSEDEEVQQNAHVNVEDTNYGLSTDVQVDSGSVNVDSDVNMNQSEPNFNFSTNFDNDHEREQSIIRQLHQQKDFNKTSFKTNIGRQYDKARDQVKEKYNSEFDKDWTDTSVFERAAKDLVEIDEIEKVVLGQFDGEVDSKVQDYIDENVEPVNTMTKEQFSSYQEQQKADMRKIYEESAYNALDTSALLGVDISEMLEAEYE